MKLYPIAPNANLVARHFEQMAKGLLPTSGNQHRGYGGLGSRFRLGSYTHMRGGAESKEPLSVRGVLPTEVGIAQAQSQLQAQANLFKKQPEKKSTKKRAIKANSTKGKRQSKSTQQRGKKSAKGKGESKSGQRGGKKSTVVNKKKEKKKKKKKKEGEKKETKKNRKTKGKVIRLDHFS
jgi:hypothetical protein